MIDQKEKPYRVWAFHDAPKELQMPFNGGDEDWIVVGECPIPYPLTELSNDNDYYRVDMRGQISMKAAGSDDLWTHTEYTAPNFLGCYFLIASHA